MWTFILVVLTILTIIWLVTFVRVIQPTEVGKVKCFGKLGKRLTNKNGFLNTGLHLVVPFPGIELLRLPIKLHEFVYKGDPNKPSCEISGTQIPVRSKDRQKLGIDMVAFLRLPFEDDKQLDLIIESDVPYYDEKELRSWFETAFSTDLVSVFGKYDYEETMGGGKK